MRQELQTWRSEAGSRHWLSALISAMEDAAQPARGPVEPSALEGFRSQLALSASLSAYHGPVSYLRH